MSEILDLANSIANTKERLRQTLCDKGVYVGPEVKFEEYPDKLGEIHADPRLDEKYIYENGEYWAEDDELDGYNYINVNVNQNTQEIDINSNGDYYPEGDNIGFRRVHVDIPSRDPILQEKTIIANGEITPDRGYDGLSKVTVNVPTTDPTITLYATRWDMDIREGSGQKVFVCLREVDMLNETTEPLFRYEDNWMDIRGDNTSRNDDWHASHWWTGYTTGEVDGDKAQIKMLIGKPIEVNLNIEDYDTISLKGVKL